MYFACVAAAWRDHMKDKETARWPFDARDPEDEDKVGSSASGVFAEPGAEVSANLPAGNSADGERPAAVQPPVTPLKDKTGHNPKRRKKVSPRSGLSLQKKRQSPMKGDSLPVTDGNDPENAGEAGAAVSDSGHHENTGRPVPPCRLKWKA